MGNKNSEQCFVSIQHENILLQPVSKILMHFVKPEKVRVQVSWLKRYIGLFVIYIYLIWDAMWVYDVAKR